jgi:NarL family two-component system response regulator LiaR
MSDTPIRVAVADDHPIVRQGLRLLLSVEPEFTLVGEAKDGAEIVTLAAATAPDVVVLDLMMPGVDGVAAIPELLRVAPRARILILTSFTDDEKVVAALQAGATGCMIKDSSPDELLAAIKAVARGENALHPVVAQRLVQRLSRPAPQRDRLHELTSRELEVLRCVGHGMSNQQIANALSLSIRTVHAHMRNILDKLNLDNRIQIALFAKDNGLI